jgi:hypothetical protein
MTTNKKLSATITIGGALSSSLKSAFSSTTTQLQGIGKEIGNLTKQQKLLGSSIGVFGRMGKDVDGLRTKYAAVTASIDKMRAAQDKLAASNKRHEALQAISAKMTRIGVGATAIGAAIGVPLFSGVKEAKHYDTEKARVVALGMGDKTNKEAFEFARTMKTYGTSQLENLELMRDGLSIFSDLHHAETLAPIMAKMKFANAAVFGAEHGGSNSAAFQDMLKVIELRGGANDETTAMKHANLIQQVISATGGRVKGDEWRNVMSTGGTAAKLMRDDAFYYQLEPLIQMMGGDKVGTGLSASYGSLYQGRTTKRAATNLDKYGLIGDKSKVKHDKVGQTSQIDPGALLGSKLFRESQYEWVKQVLLPTLAKKGITDKKEIVDVIASFVSNKKGADLLSAMVLQQTIIDKDINRNTGASNVKQLDEQAKKTTSGKELEAEAKLADAKLRMGNAILPLYTSALESASSALEKLNSFIDNNPKLSTAMIIGLGSIATVLAVGGPILIGLAVLPMALTGAATAFGILGTVMEVVAGALLLNPIGLAVTGIAVSALLIYKYWTPISAFFIDMWDGIKLKFTDAIEFIMTKIAWVGEKWAAFKKFIGLGDAATPADMNNTDNVPLPAPIPPVPMAGGAGAGPTKQENTFHITQLPGQDSADLARQIAKHLDQQNSVKRRSSMYDTVAQ